MCLVFLRVCQFYFFLMFGMLKICCDFFILCLVIPQITTANDEVIALDQDVLSLPPPPPSSSSSSDSLQPSIPLEEQQSHNGQVETVESNEFDNIQQQPEEYLSTAKILPRQMPNLETLGSGYDLFWANPHATPPHMVDPGLRASIFDLQQQDQQMSGLKTTSDGRYFIPRYVNLKACQSCSLNFKTNKMTNVHDYVQALKASYLAIIGDSPFPEASFAASNDLKEVESLLRTGDNMIVESLATCIAYCATLDKFDNPPLTSSFRRAVAKLPLVNVNDSQQIYDEFIEYFGTHLIYSVNFGSRYGLRTSICRRRALHLHEQGVNFDLAAGNVALINAGDASANHTQANELFLRSTSNMAFISFGAKPELGSSQRWLQQTELAPQPITLALQPIDEILTRENFAALLPAHLESKRRILRESIQNYCHRKLYSRVSTCYGHVARPPVNFGQLSSTKRN